MEGKIPNLNLIRQVNPESTIRQPSFYKPLIFDIFAVATAFAAGYVYKSYLAHGVNLAELLLAVGIYGIFSTLQVFLDKSFGHRFLVLLLEIAALLILFYEIDLILLGVSVAVLLVFLLWGELAARSILENGLEIKFFKAAMPALKKFTTAMSLVLVLLYIPSWNGNRVFVSEINFQSFFGWAAEFMAKFHPEIDLNSTFSRLTDSVARLQLRGNQNFKNLTMAAQESAIKSQSSALAEALSKSLGMVISGAEETNALVYDVIVRQLSEWRDDFKIWFVVGWVLVVFFIVRGFGIFFYSVIALLSFIVYQILIASGFIQILGESRTHEVITY